MVSERLLLVTEPRLVGAGCTGGLTTRRGFPAATTSGPDDPSRALARATLARCLHLPEARMAWLHQVHGATAIEADSGGLAAEADALVTRIPGLALLVAVADCGPVLLWDESAGVIGAAHAGWRGTVAGVLHSTVKAMARAGAQPDRVRAWVGPCIGTDHFEVGEEVADRFEPAVVRPPETPAGKPHIDLRAAIRIRLLEAGLHPGHIRVSGECTFELSDRYWSYRRDGGICGRQLAWIVRA